MVIHFPKKQGLYDPQFEKDSCGVGFVCNITGKQSYELVTQGLQVLKRLAHRGAVGADPMTGDGAGILLQIPHDFFNEITQEIKIKLPEKGNYAVGLIFLPTDKNEYQFCKDIIQTVIKEEEQILLGWRTVPVDSTTIGKTAQKTQPRMEHVFIQKNKNIHDSLDFERKLYIIRKRIENYIRTSKLTQKTSFYITNISSRTLIYKGLLMPDQVDKFFVDLTDSRIKSSLAIIHSRYSTNTFPTWDLSQPFRFLAHNGEINTLRGNINWMQARQGLLKSNFFGDSLEKIKPIIVPGGSDSATIDNVFELLTLSGRSLPHVMMMLIPSAWEQNKFLNKKIRGFYQYHATFMEAWDGPAAMAFTDGIRVGAVLDRNGLRPARYLITKDDFVVMASEVGVLDIPASNIAFSGRLEPGKIFFIDTEEKRIIQDDEVKSIMASRRPYHIWIQQHLVNLDNIKNPKVKNSKKDFDLTLMLKTFGYTREDLKMVIRPMIEDAQEPTGSMGNDTPHAILSTKPQLLYSYFKQLFAQVTNPPIDPIREEIVTSLDSYLGPQKNILNETSIHCHKLYVKNPIFLNTDCEKIKQISINGFKTKIISLLFDVNKKNDFMQRLDIIGTQAALAIKQGYSFIVLSDKGINNDYAALPALLAVGTVHHYLIKQGLRTQISLILESAEPREVHHFALLFGYGVDCINPYLAYEACKQIIREDNLAISNNIAINNYRKAINKGILKILSKMGISTLQSYRGAQIFEALGIKENVIERCFTGTVSRIGGIDFEIIEQETILRHKEAYNHSQQISSPYLSTGGIYQWKRDGIFHLWNPESIVSLQNAAKTNNYEIYKEFSQRINDQSQNPTTLRSLLKFKKTESITLSFVESEHEIVKRFVTGAMSFGSISRAAHETLAIAMNRLKGKSNTGEGGEDPKRFVYLPNGDSKRSAIKQVASGRFGVTTNYLVNADELQIKICQGAKPGEGGQLPGHKVSAIIAKTRYTTPGVTLISPPPHHDIYSIEDLAQLIFDLKNVNPSARISVKLVSAIGIGTIAAGVAKGHADMILVSGGDGGTGASPLSSIYHAGLPWELGLSETHQTLVLNNLRNRVRLQTDGQMRTGKDVAIAAMLGAEEYGFCTAALIVMGCVMLRHCNLNNCSVGVATQDEVLEKRFQGKVENVINYFFFVAKELREIMAQLGIKTIDELIGRTDLLETNMAIIPWKAKKIDYSRILYKPEIPQNIHIHCTQKQEHNIENVLDRKIIELSKEALEKAEPINIDLSISNINRTVGAMLSGEVCKRYGEDGLPENTIVCKFNGIAGQSFGAFLMKGITFQLKGFANDYVGKGISGGKIIIYPDYTNDNNQGENVIIGNTTFYGAICGEAYIRGIAGERFCIRNSGLYGVIEGVGDHACEYMTGGRVIVLGKTGRNFAAGMSGGIAYVWGDENFADKYNSDMVKLEKSDDDDITLIYNLLYNHFQYTKSSRARYILDHIKNEQKNFIKVMPIEYKRILDSKKTENELNRKTVSDG